MTAEHMKPNYLKYAMYGAIGALPALIKGPLDGAPTWLGALLGALIAMKALQSNPNTP